MKVSEIEQRRLDLLLSFNSLRRQVMDCWMVREALSFRIVFLFPDQAILTVSAENEIWFELRNTEARKPGEDWTLEVPSRLYLPTESEVNLQDLILRTIQERGKPRLILPWEDWDRVSDRFADVDELEQVSQCKNFEQNIITYGDCELWSECEFTYGEDCLPDDCDYEKFEAFVEELEQENWIIIWDECCGTCASGSISSARESEPEKANSPVFVIWGQNADRSFHPDGSIRDYMFASDELSKERELELAQKHGFKVAKQGEYKGLFLLNPS